MLHMRVDSLHALHPCWLLDSLDDCTSWQVLRLMWPGGGAAHSGWQGNVTCLIPGKRTSLLLAPCILNLVSGAAQWNITNHELRYMCHGGPRLLPIWNCKSLAIRCFVMPRYEWIVDTGFIVLWFAHLGSIQEPTSLAITFMIFFLDDVVLPFY